MAGKKNDTDDAMAAGNVDQIREIIFGSQIREYETRFTALERQLKDAQNKLRKDFEAQMKALQETLDETRAALESEAADRQNADESLDALVQSQGGDIGRDLDASEKRFDARVDALQKSLEQTHKTLDAELSKQTNALDRELNKVSGNLQDHKVARAELAKLLTGVATKLAGAAKPKRK